MTKANVNVKIDVKTKKQTTILLGHKIIAEHRLHSQTVAVQKLDEQIAAAAIGKSGMIVDLSANQDGNIQIDKKRNPEIYDWAFNG